MDSTGKRDPIDLEEGRLSGMQMYLIAIATLIYLQGRGAAANRALHQLKPSTPSKRLQPGDIVPWRTRRVDWED